MKMKWLQEEIENFVRIFSVWMLFALKINSYKQNYLNHMKWKKRFLMMAFEKDKRTLKILQEFLNTKISKIYNNNLKRTSKYSPILICVIKNDIGKIELFFKHYRKLGIEMFVFVDNMSTDGTREFICRQKDAVCYSANQEYSSERRVAWINRVIAEWGEKKWYLVVDSDEFLNYIGMENHSIKDLICEAELKNYNRIQGFMLDMYTKENMFEVSENDKLLENCCYYDKNTYKLNKSDMGTTIRGGARKRVFGQNMRLSKIPLFYFDDTDIVASSHYMLPKVKNINIPMWFAICHYKFISQSDYEKVQQAVINENYAGKSADYKIYLNKIRESKQLSFYDEKYSVKIENSEGLKNIKFLERVFDERRK